MAEQPLDAVTGAFGYTGRYIAGRLLASGRLVRSLTGHPDRPNPLGAPVEVRPLRFDAPAALQADLAGVDTLYCTYWVRYARGALTHARATEHLQSLFGAARAAGVRRLVYVSITGASAASPLPYFRGKGLVEQALRASGLGYAIVRPTLVFGEQDILLHNIAWLLRRFPVFTVFGDGRYPVQPVFVDDLAELAIRLGQADADMECDAAGPERYAFADLVRRIGGAIGHPRPLLHVRPKTALALATLVGALVGDVVVTRDEIAGLTAGLLVPAGAATGHTPLGAWLDAHGKTLGRHYASETARHYT